MKTLLALIATALACALARPPVATEEPPMAPCEDSEGIPVQSSPELLSAYILPRLLMPQDIVFDDSPRMPRPYRNLLDQEINLINQMQLETIAPWRLSPSYVRHLMANQFEDYDVMPPHQSLESVALQRGIPETPEEREKKEALKKAFALTPLDDGYFEESNTTSPGIDERRPDYDNIEPRQTRQNPNWSKTRTFVSDDLDLLRTGFTHGGEYGTDTPHLHLHVLETPTADPAQSIYGVALLAAVGAALTMALVGFAFGWYTLSRKAKAAADVDYPAYGVTGPTIDPSGDKKLAQSAHMYHYQHQKQQIIAMERNTMDRNGSVSDPESEEENEEGDYTVYECPGFATTGAMEVKNPLFKEEITPASPKSDAVKPEPKE